jgi:ubiquinone/menaquinone biosynthesis C-methylase UbiE
MNKAGLEALNPGEVILEVGCGRGDNVFSFAERGAALAFGIDITSDASWSSRPGERVSFATASADCLPFRDATFDTIYIKDVLHHVEHIESVMADIHRVVKPGGRIIIVESNRYHPISYFTMVRMRGHEHFTKRTFDRLVFAPPLVGSRIRVWQFEAHVLPIPWRWLRAAGELCEDIFERVPVMRRVSSYNVASVGKGA